MVSLLPQVMQDESNLALEKCANYAFDIDLKPLMIYCFRNVKKEFLPILAEQFHILGDEGWNFATTEQEQRNLLENALIIHRYKGTKFALKKVLETLNIEGDIKEWFEYEGQPYYFKVVLNITNKSLTDDLEQSLIKLINQFKNERSWLEAIEIYLNSIAQRYIYTHLMVGEIVTIPAKEG